VTVWDKILKDRASVLDEQDAARYLELEERYRPGGGGLTEQEREEHNMLRWLAISRVNSLYGGDHG